jgi:hypothetical protein
MKAGLDAGEYYIVFNRDEERIPFDLVQDFKKYLIYPDMVIVLMLKARL